MVKKSISFSIVILLATSGDTSLCPQVPHIMARLAAAQLLPSLGRQSNPSFILIVLSLPGTAILV